MRVITAHKILIGTATAFFVFYAGWEVLRYARGADAWALLRGLVALAVAVVLGWYVAYLFRCRTLAGLAEGLTKPRKTP